VIAERLRREVLHANQVLGDSGLVMATFGNVSGVDRDAGLLVIKPSGVAYQGMTPADLVPVSLADGRVLEGTLRPSSDTPTHLELYRRFATIGGVVHTHSSFASAWAQASRSIPPLGTTHADHFAGAVPITRPLRNAEIEGDYERETGVAIGEAIEALDVDPLHLPAALVASHGPFTWGTDADDAVTAAIALEAVATMAHRTLALDPRVEPIGDALLRRHFQRKHGPTAYYGQRKA
jgi:L-ribulose-5-phosphate 4-epimerase